MLSSFLQCGLKNKISNEEGTIVPVRNEETEDFIKC